MVQCVDQTASSTLAADEPRAIHVVVAAIRARIMWIALRIE
jgi:hypothetical protein